MADTLFYLGITVLSFVLGIGFMLLARKKQMAFWGRIALTAFGNGGILLGLSAISQSGFVHWSEAMDNWLRLGMLVSMMVGMVMVQIHACQRFDKAKTVAE
jgi:hypothetical protein